MGRTVKVIVIAVGMVILGGGVGFTIFEDYLPWKHAETDNFGHGPGEIGAMGSLTKLFQDSLAGVRINYPPDFKPRLVWGNKNWKNKSEVVIFTNSEFGTKVTVSKFEQKGSVVDIADAMAATKKSLGWVAAERQYVNAQENITILTWDINQPDGSKKIVQAALAKSGDVLVVVEVSCNEENWKSLLGVVWEMYKTLVII